MLFPWEMSRVLFCVFCGLPLESIFQTRHRDWNVRGTLRGRLPKHPHKLLAKLRAEGITIPHAVCIAASTEPVDIHTVN